MSDKFNQHFDQGPQQDIANTGSMDSGEVSDVGALHPSTGGDVSVDGVPASIPWGNQQR